MAVDLMKTAKFVASFPPIQSAIKIYGDESGMRIQMEIPESEMAESVKLLTMRGKRLAVTVKSLTDLDDETNKIAEGGGTGMDRRRFADR